MFSVILLLFTYNGFIFRRISSSEITIIWSIIVGVKKIAQA